MADANKILVRVTSFGAAEAYRTAYTKAIANGYDWSVKEQIKICSVIGHVPDIRVLTGTMKPEDAPTVNWAPDEWLAAQSGIEQALKEISGNFPPAEIVIELV